MLNSRRFLTVAGSVAITISLAACATTPSTGNGSEPTTGDGELRIFAAASLQGAFTELAEIFGEDNPEVKVAPITFDGSATLATQINEGAPADIFASADAANMQKVAEAIVGEPKDFASNFMKIAVAPGNPLGIDSLGDLTATGLRVVVCAPGVPCGTVAESLLSTAGVDLKPASEEANVRAVLAKVIAGEADAGLVYSTDVQSAEGKVTGVEIAGAEAARNLYPIATLKGADPAAAKFIQFVLSDAGQAVLAKYGFGAP